MTRVVVTGVAGRMGQEVARLALEHGPAAGGGSEGTLTLCGATERPGQTVGVDVGTLLGFPAATGVTVAGSLEEALAGGADAVVDFTAPEASAAHAELCAARGVALVIGSTGFSHALRARVEAAARRIPVVLSPNFSVGVNVLFALVDAAARTLGEAFDVEVMELHHRRKVDAPSGTALRLAEVAAAALGRDPARDLLLARQGQVGQRPAGQIGVQSLRGGDVVGDHTVFFAGEGERLELTHRATSRLQFARGALRAAAWAAGRPAGLHDMADVLGLRRTA